ncbi:hypothetical protein CPC735_055710 [Coccidioides posadasii C735 delta SOWgp]|uniref:Uncharacterized protein n=2 Tax=Coccidioides posadasii TaxID=199306 RepID=A0A0J6FA36_COCPO|nr:hypothetical protein CPC735_055710 [Coccidioides posadasii C735 delta SOWgp]EER24201.1 hypothetical protein CPC735_055710 [Coccidioides posadasii C735 delta SOWgp]KMM65819.1 hypothetical protein CPAG_02162 [Coccidioides posadasii RMSCC 3488]|eukprot:XP_003066346.1 hypothetical protein CPC735_055710 [Coccidioides posadasii C735 delta SOWgp]
MSRQQNQKTGNAGRFSIKRPVCLRAREGIYIMALISPALHFPAHNVSCGKLACELHYTVSYAGGFSSCWTPSWSYQSHEPPQNALPAFGEAPGHMSPYQNRRSKRTSLLSGRYTPHKWV